jgi:hypothetical protein
MIEITLSKLMNSTPVGYLTDGLWITKGGKVLPRELNEFADYELTNNPNPESIKLEYPDYERLTRDYFATLPKNLEMRSQVTKHLEGKHDQSTHGRGKGSMANKPATTPKVLSPEQIEAVRKYTTASGAAINHYARTGKMERWNAEGFTEDDMKQIIPMVDSAVQNSVIQESLILQRVVRIQAFGEEMRALRDSNATVAQLNPLVGTTITEKAFLSTTKNSKIPGILIQSFGAIPQQVLITVHAPAGVKALDLQAIGLSNDEGEVLFPRNASFKVLSVSPSRSEDFGALMEIEMTQ